MRELNWFMSTLEGEFNVKVHEDSISFEGNELYLEELDEALIPSPFRNDLPEPLLLETMVFDSEDGTEWLGFIAMDINTRHWFLQGILKGGELVLIKKVGGKSND